VQTRKGRGRIGASSTVGIQRSLRLLYLQ